MILLLLHYIGRFKKIFITLPLFLYLKKRYMIPEEISFLSRWDLFFLEKPIQIVTSLCYELEAFCIWGSG